MILDASREIFATTKRISGYQMLGDGEVAMGLEDDTLSLASFRLPIIWSHASAEDFAIV